MRSIRGAHLHPSLMEGLALPLLAKLESLLERGADRAGRADRRSPVLALNGPVGAGKTTLTGVLQELAADRGIRLAVASIDDVYLPWPERRRVLAGNPFGVWRVPPGSHDIPLLIDQLELWRDTGTLRLPRFDKTLADGQGDRAGWSESEVDAVLIEGWLMGCRALGRSELERRMASGTGLGQLSQQERDWLPRWDGHLDDYSPLWELCDSLWVLRPSSWSLPRRWRFQAEARQRRRGGGWLRPLDLERLVRASLHSLPPKLYQDPLLEPSGAAEPLDGGLPLEGGVVLDGLRRSIRSISPEDLGSAQLSSPSSAIG